jgi:hypothetical protein
MWIVQLAVHRPYTFAVLALLIAVLGATTQSIRAVMPPGIQPPSHPPSEYRTKLLGRTHICIVPINKGTR